MKKINALIGQGLAHTKSSQKRGFPMAGPLSLIFSSVKVTASDSAGVTVSMTLEDSAGYANLSSPKLARAKDRQYHSPTQGGTVTSRNAINGLASAHMVGACPDNLLNKKAESAFVQADDVAQTLCVTISNSQNQQRLGSLRPRHVQKNDFRTLEDVQVTGEKKGSIRSATLWHGEKVIQLWDSCLALLRSRRFISVRSAVIINCPTLSLSPLVFTRSSNVSRGILTAVCFDLLFTVPVDTFNLLSYWWLTVYSKNKLKKYLKCEPPKNIVVHTLDVIRYKNGDTRKCGNTLRVPNQTVIGVNDMACSHDTQARPKFTDTYWIVPCYETTPYGKVSFTRQDRRTFIAMFKDSCLIWAGRQPVKNLTENVICTQLQVGVKHTRSPKECLKDPVNEKLSLKDCENSTMSAKGTESRSQFDQSSGLLVRKMSHEDIEKISIPQGGVNITPPSTPTITNIVTVQGGAHV